VPKKKPPPRGREKRAPEKKTPPLLWGGGKKIPGKTRRLKEKGEKQKELGGPPKNETPGRGAPNKPLEKPSLN